MDPVLITSLVSFRNKLPFTFLTNFCGYFHLLSCNRKEMRMFQSPNDAKALRTRWYPSYQPRMRGQGTEPSPASATANPKTKEELGLKQPVPKTLTAMDTIHFKRYKTYICTVPKDEKCI